MSTKPITLKPGQKPQYILKVECIKRGATEDENDPHLKECATLKDVKAYVAWYKSAENICYQPNLADYIFTYFAVKQTRSLCLP